MPGQTKKPSIRALRTPILMFLIFWALAAGFWQGTGDIFYLFNFGYIGTSLGLGLGAYSFLPRKRKPSGRRLAQFLVGGYMLIFLGLLKYENMQIEGFFFYLLIGLFTGSTIHYLVAKVAGPLIFNRAWCSWACWTAMILDLLPYKQNKNGRIDRKWEWMRYAHFLLSLGLVAGLFFLAEYRPEPFTRSELIWLVTGNLFYYSLAIWLALGLKDNRAFCKYACPITVIMKGFSRFALLKIAGDADRCTDCGVCAKTCPMDIDIPRYIREGRRVLSTECIFCLTCTNMCPEGILSETFKLDLGGLEYLRRRDS